MTDRQSVWYRLGYALESARPPGAPSKKGGRLRNPFAKNGKTEAGVLDELFTVGAGALIGRMLARGRPGTLRLLRAATAGATAAAARSALRALLDLEPEGSAVEPTREVLGGAARGLLYGAVVEPYVPGSPVARGVAFGTMEYMVAPLGGLDEVLGAASPRRTMPVLGTLLALERSPSESFTDHLIFGATLGLLYGLGRAKRGSREVV